MTLKRLYVYTLVVNDPKKYVELVRKAHQHADTLKLADTAKRREARSKLEVLPEGVHLEQFYQRLTQDEKDQFEQADLHEEPDFENINTSIITQELMDYIKVEDYEDIISKYVKEDKFSSHLLLDIAIRMNEMLQRFCNISELGGYGICMGNIYISLIDKYGDDVPAHILRKYQSYERREELVAFNEKHVFYMFLTKITSEIELMNPKTRIKAKLLFPLKPNTFFLTKSTKQRFIRTADTGAMLVDMIQIFKTLQNEMNDNLTFYRKYPLLYTLTSDDTFYYIKYTLWILGLILNVILVVFFRRDSTGYWFEGNGELILDSLAIIIAGFGFIFTSAWFFSRYR